MDIKISDPKIFFYHFFLSQILQSHAVLGAVIETPKRDTSLTHPELILLWTDNNLFNLLEFPTINNWKNPFRISYKGG